MDGARYIDLKKKGTVRIMRLGKGHFAMGIQKFDPESGAEQEPELVRITRDEIAKAKTSYQAAIASLDVLLADMDADEAAQAKPV